VCENAISSYHAHVDFRVNMAQNDDNQTPNMAQDNRQSPPPPTPPRPPLTPLPPTPPRFTVEEEQTRVYRRFNAQGTQLTVRLLPPPEGQDSNPMSHFLDSVTELFEYALPDLEDRDMVGITISNEVEVKDRAIGICFRRRDRITGDVIWSVFEVAQLNARFNALDKLVVTVYSVRMPIGHGGDGIATKGRPLEIMVRLKRYRTIQSGK